MTATAGSEASRAPLNVAIVLYDGVEVLDFADPAEVFATAAQQGTDRDARASAREFRPTTAWSVALVVDLDGDGTTDLEGVTRCGQEIRSGCGEPVCDRDCHGTRTAGTSEVRGERCVGFIPDVDDCAPSNVAR